MNKEEIRSLLERMTIEEKAALLSGKNEWQTWDFPRLQIPSLFCSDGPSGLRKQEGAGDHLGLNASVPATCFPSAATMANSWDESLCREVGEALGKEAGALGVNILLGPGLNIKRSPLGGRSFEYFSEDPYLSGKLAAAYIRGIQEQGVSACPKHFAVNSQETRRMASNSVVDERTLRELYLSAFETAVKEGGAKAIMSAYNEINGTYANQNGHLLKDILRKEWGFDGLVITDWGGSDDHVAGVKNGSDLEMPCPGFDSARQLLKALEDGKLSMEEVDACAEGLLTAAITLNRKEKKQGMQQEQQAQHHELAKRAAAQSIVLLKNEDNILPLPNGSTVALIGEFAEKPRYQGAGSSMVNPTRLDTIKEEIKDQTFKLKGYARGYKRSGEADAELLMEARKLAKEAEYVIYCFGLDELSESEGLDREHLRIPENQIMVLNAIAEVNPRVIGVLSAGAPVEMPWEKQCRGLLHGYLSGQAGAAAMLDVIAGKQCPCGKLNESYPFTLEDTPAFGNFPGKERDVQYREGLYVGYRYYDTAEVPVRYPFGYGLSYTTFEYRELQADRDGISLLLTNTGNMAGAEIVQVYVSLPGAKVFRPKKELKGFAKVYLEPGESRRVEISFGERTFQYWNVRTGRWEVEQGDYRILAGASSRDIRLEAELHLEGTAAVLPYQPDKLPHYHSGKIHDVQEQEFELLLGYPLSVLQKGKRLLTVNDPFCSMSSAKSRAARLLCRYMEKLLQNSQKKGKPDLNLIFIYNMPFRAIAKMTEGMVSMEMADGMVTAVNGHLAKGIGKMISGFFRNKKENKEYLAKITNGDGKSL